MTTEIITKKLESNSAVAKRAMTTVMERVIEDGITKRSKSGTSIVWATPVNGRNDLAGLLFQAVAQFQTAGLLEALEAEFDQQLEMFTRRSQPQRAVQAEKRAQRYEAKKALEAERAAKLQAEGQAKMDAQRAAEALATQRASEALEPLFTQFEAALTAGDLSAARVAHDQLDRQWSAMTRMWKRPEDDLSHATSAAIAARYEMYEQYETADTSQQRRFKRLQARLSQAKSAARPTAPARQRFLCIADDAPAASTTFQKWGKWLFSLGCSESTWRLSQRQIDDEGMFEFEGRDVTYVYYREATTEEIAAALVAREAAVKLEAETQQNDAQFQARRLRNFVQRNGVPGVDQGNLERVVFTWNPVVSGDSKVTISVSDTLIRLYERFAPGGDFTSDHVEYTLPLERLPDDLRGALNALGVRHE